MKLLSKTLCLCLALALTNAAPTHHEHGDAVKDGGLFLTDRCDGIEFDAIAPDEKGQAFFFKGDHLWKGFRGPAELSNETFKELDDFHHLGHVDAAFRMHNEENPHDHDHIYFLLDNKVFSYYNHTLEDGYPKEIQDDFPGVPSHLDAAVECPKGECGANSVLFFQGHNVHTFDITTKTVKTKTWSHLPNCTSAFRWLEHYYCFHGHNFTKFHPVSGVVEGVYPKDARNYFMSCAGFGHGGGYKVPKCSEVHVDAITSDDAGKTYAFIGSIYMRLDSHRDGFHAFPITRGWKEVTDGVDAVFSHTDKLYMIKGDQVYIYKSAVHYTLIEGYPKSLKEELGLEGSVDAAFACPGTDVVHVIQGKNMIDINLSTTPRTVGQGIPLPLSNITAGLCGPGGIRVFQGSDYYTYDSPLLLAASRIAPVPLKITSGMMGCQD
ncbi:hemopexin [Centroberyx affinis]|uniref:hemopexin n=1 Tax=Centroberyx affinis TaxID=166261 RepID=UPI003A5C706C